MSIRRRIVVHFQFERRREASIAGNRVHDLLQEPRRLVDIRFEARHGHGHYVNYRT